MHVDVKHLVTVCMTVLQRVRVRFIHMRGQRDSVVLHTRPEDEFAVLGFFG